MKTFVLYPILTTASGDKIYPQIYVFKYLISWRLVQLQLNRTKNDIFWTPKIANLRKIHFRRINSFESKTFFEILFTDCKNSIIFILMFYWIVRKSLPLQRWYKQFSLNIVYDYYAVLPCFYFLLRVVFSVALKKILIFPIKFNQITLTSVWPPFLDP